MNTNNGGVTNVDVLSVGALYINGQRLKDIVLGLQSSISLNQDQITAINAFLARLDLQITDPNILTLTNDNRNQVLKTLIDALNTKTNYLDTTALTQSWAITDTNRNAILKTRIDGNDTSLGLLNTKTQYITSVQGNNSTTPKTKSTCLIEVYDRDENRILLNTGALNYLSINSFSDSSQNTAILCNAGGVAQVVGKNVKITPFNSSDNIDIGLFGSSNTGQVNIGGSLSKINIGSYEDPIFATTIGALGYNDNTIITIGKRTTLKNTLTYLNGNINTGDSRFISLNVTDVVTWETLASWLAGFTLSNAPYWLAYFAISGTPNYRYSDVIKMANNYLTGGLTKNNSIETSNDLGLKKLTVVDTSVVGLSTAFDALLQRLVFQAFAVHGSHSIGSIWGQTDIYAGSGNVIMRCDGGAIDWAFKNAGNTNYVKVSNLDTEVVQCNGSGGNGTLKLGAFNGNIDMYVGTAGTQASGTKVIQVKSTKQVIVGDNDTQANRYDATTKLILDQTNLNDGLKVCKAGSTSITRVNYDNITTPSINVTTLVPTNITGWNVKSLVAGSGITLSNNAGEYTINSSSSGGSSGGGTTFILTNATSVVNTSPINTLTTTYSSTAKTTITRNGYTANTTYAMGEFKSGYILSSTNLVLAGSYSADLFGLLTANQPCNLYSKLYHIAERATPSTQFIVDKSLIYTTGSNTTNYQTLSTKPLPVPVNETSITLYQVVIPQLQTISSPTGSELITLRLALISVNSVGTETTQYIFPTQTATIGNQTADRTFAVSGGSTTIDMFNLTSFYFKLTLTDDFSQGSVMRQALMRSDTDIVYKVAMTTKTLIYNGTSNRTTLTAGSTLVYQLEMPFSFNSYDISDYTDYSKIQLEPFFIQPSGSTTGHSFVLSFQDGALSHLTTSISSVGASTLAQVLTAGNTANTSINMNGNNITSVGTISPSAITGWNVKNINGGSGISVANSSGTITISATTSANDSEPAQLISASSALPSKPYWYNTIYSWLYNSSNVLTTDNYLDNCVSNTGQYQLIISSDRIRYSVDWGVTWGNTAFTSFSLNGVCITGSGNRYYINGAYRVFYFDATYSTFGTGASYLTSFPTLSGSLNYTRMKCSQDGKYILIGGSGGYATIYQSNDYGFTSTQQNTQGALINIDDVAMSADGKYQFLMFRQTGAIAGRVMYSTNYGVTFSSPTMPSGVSYTLIRVACSATGQYVVTINQSVGILFSTDYGKNYFASSISGTNNFIDICMSANGQFVLAITYTQVFYSEDYGRSFLTSTGTLTGATPFLQTIACSATAGYACVAGDGGRTWVIYDTPTDVRQLVAGSGTTISPNGFGTYTISASAVTPTYTIINELVTTTPSIDGYLTNGWTSSSTITWDFDNFEYDIQFDLQIGASGYYPTNIYWAWDNTLSASNQYHHSWLDHDGLNIGAPTNGYFGSGQDTDNRLIYTYNTANTHHNFNMRLRRVRCPNTSYYQRLLIECNCNQIIVGTGTSNISGVRMPYSRTNNYFFANSTTPSVFNGAKTLIFYGKLNSCSSTSTSGNSAWLRITKRPIT